MARVVIDIPQPPRILTTIDARPSSSSPARGRRGAASSPPSREARADRPAPSGAWISTATALACAGPGVLRPSATNRSSRPVSRRTTSGCSSCTFRRSPGSDSRLNSCTGGRCLVSSLPGRGALHPPEPGHKASFQRPWRIANEPLIEWWTTASWSRRVGPAQEGRHQAHAVLARPVGQLRADDLRARGQHIGQADQLVRDAARGDPARPSDDERDVVAAVVNVGLVAPEHVARVMPLGEQRREVGLRRAPVVAGQEDQGVLRQAVAVEGLEQLRPPRDRSASRNRRSNSGRSCPAIRGSG